MTFATLRHDGAYSLGLRTEHGILDVAAAEQDFKQGAPTTITAVFNGQGDVSGLKRLAAKAAAANRHFIAEDKAKFGPAVTDPEKIVCIGLNYRRHAAETGNPVPKMPILFNKYNTALNCCGGTVAVSKEKAEKFDYEAELRDRDRPHRAQCQRGRRAELYFRLRLGQRLHRARPAVAIEPVDDRQDRWTARAWSGRGWSPPTRSTATI